MCISMYVGISLQNTLKHVMTMLTYYVRWTRRTVATLDKTYYVILLVYIFMIATLFLQLLGL